jgi:hypothetical protein
MSSLRRFVSWVMVMGDVFVGETVVSGDAFPWSKGHICQGKGLSGLALAAGNWLSFPPLAFRSSLTPQINSKHILQAIKSSYPPSLSWFSRGIFALLHLADEDFDEPKRGTTIPK